MSNLFSVFSPVAFWGLPLNWVSIFMVILIMPVPFWSTRPQASVLVSLVMKSVALEFKSLLGPLAAPGLAWVFLSLFLFIAVINLQGLLPYAFTASSHLSVTASLALPLWAGYVFMSWALQPKFALAHLVPTGTPPALLVFMVLIELLSTLIRPLTLSVRLTANMVAGHLLFALVSGLMSTHPSALVLCALVALGVLEFAVALIQAYVLSLLSVLYAQEVQTAVISRPK